MMKKVFYVATMMLATIFDDALGVTRCYQEEGVDHWYNGKLTVPTDEILKDVIAATTSSSLSWSDGSEEARNAMCPGPYHNFEMGNCNATVSIETKEDNQDGPGFLSIKTWLMEQGYEMYGAGSQLARCDPELLLVAGVAGYIATMFILICVCRIANKSTCCRGSLDAQGANRRLLDRNRRVPSISDMSEESNGIPVTQTQAVPVPVPEGDVEYAESTCVSFG